MKKTDMLAYREKLHAIRARLRGDVTAMADVALRKSGMEGNDSGAMPIHMAELGSDPDLLARQAVGAIREFLAALRHPV